MSHGPRVAVSAEQHAPDARGLLQPAFQFPITLEMRRLFDSLPRPEHERIGRRMFACLRDALLRRARGVIRRG